jgi:hypothetical protein
MKEAIATSTERLASPHFESVAMAYGQGVVAGGSANQATRRIETASVTSARQPNSFRAPTSAVPKSVTPIVGAAEGGLTNKNERAGAHVDVHVDEYGGAHVGAHVHKGEEHTEQQHENFCVVTYNILADFYHGRDLRKAAKSKAEELLVSKAQKRRSQLIVSEVVAYGPDVVCLQEVDTSAFQNLFVHALSR